MTTVNNYAFLADLEHDLAIDPDQARTRVRYVLDQHQREIAERTAEAAKVTAVTRDEAERILVQLPPVEPEVIAARQHALLTTDQDALDAWHETQRDDPGAIAERRAQVTRRAHAA